MSDLALLQPTATARKRISVFTTPRLVSGPELLGQRLLHLLLRDRNDKFGRGTNLMASLRSGIMSAAVMKSVVQLAAISAVAQLPTGDPDETVDSVRILSVTRDADRLVISLAVTTVSGQTATTTAAVRQT